jgi:hypothetical protein
VEILSRLGVSDFLILIVLQLMYSRYLSAGMVPGGGGIGLAEHACTLSLSVWARHLVMLLETHQKKLWDLCFDVSILWFGLKWGDVGL